MTHIDGTSRTAQLPDTGLQRTSTTAKEPGLDSIVGSKPSGLNDGTAFLRSIVTPASSLLGLASSGWESAKSLIQSAIQPTSVKVQALLNANADTVMALIEASKKDDSNLVHALLIEKEKGDPDLVHALQATALMAASQSSATNTVRYLLYMGADANAKAANGETALMAASKPI